MGKFFNHLRTITKHRHLVCAWCFKMGIPFQGLVHDLSKYSPTELSVYKYWNGKQSPHDICRDIKGYSAAWLHHKAKNKHHWEYWLDNTEGHFVPVKVPYKYVIEMFCDFIAAGKTYKGDAWTEQDPLNYFNAKKDKRLYHKETKELLGSLFEKLAELGEEEFLKYYKANKEIIKEKYE